MRKDRSFDDIIKDKLNKVSPAYQPENWERFRERLDEEHQDEVQDMEFFDRLVRQKTPSVSNAGLSGNWTTLINRLDLMYRREREIAVSKVLELIALSLLLWIVDTHVMTQDTGIVFASNEFQNTRHTAQDRVNNTSENKNSDSDFQQAELERLAQQPSFASDMENTSDGQEPFQLPTQFGEPVNQFITDQYPRELSSYLVPGVQVHLPKPIEYNLNAPTFDATAPDVVAEILPKSNSKKFTLSMFGSTDINSIYTPGSVEGPFSELDRTTFTIPALQRYSLGYSGGAALALEKGRWETEIGMLYTAKIYKARPVLYVTGSVSEGFSAEGLKDIELNMVSVPFQLKYNWLDKNGWRIYGGLGASVNVVLESSYLLTDEDAFHSSSFNLRLPNPEPTGVPKSRGLKSKNLDGGWLQGGGLANNAYITGSVSAGIDRRFSSGWSVFVQPSYQHSLYYFSKGIGPYKDQIHTFSIVSGIRVRL